MKRSFDGFSKETLDFLVSLGLNNSKNWLDSNRHIYITSLLEPFKALVEELGDFMEEIDPFLETRAQVGKTISRISKDARRNKNRPPYRTNMWFTFKVPSPDWKDSPVFFFELFHDRYRYGMGFYSPSRETMRKLLKTIEERPREFLEKTEILRQGHFQIMGEHYKRPRSKKKAPRELQIWYQLKDFYVSVDREVDEILFSHQLVELLKSEYGKLAPLYNYLWEICMKSDENV